MYIVINNENITIRKTLKQINSKLKTDFKKEDFKNFNNKYVLNCDNSDLDYKRDVNELGRIFVNKLYKKDIMNVINYGFYGIVIIMLLIIMTSITGVNSLVTDLITQLNSLVISNGVM